MKKVWVVALLVAAGCETNEVFTASLQCTTPDDACTSTQPLGIGGNIFYDGTVTLSDEKVATLATGDLHAIIGASPGTTTVTAFQGDQPASKLALTVAQIDNLGLVGTKGLVIEGPDADATYDASYRVDASVTADFDIHPSIGDVRSQGFHVYVVSLDGALLECQGSFCTGPAYSSNISLGTLSPGEHVVSFEGQDGGRSFTYRLVAQ